MILTCADGPRRIGLPRRVALVPLRDRFRAGLEKGELTLPNPVDRGKYGSKIHLITDRNGLPLSVGISRASVNDSQALVPLVQGIPPTALAEDLGGADRQNCTPTRAGLHRPAAMAIGSWHSAPDRPQGNGQSQRLGRHRWVVERTVSWLAGCCRLHHRYKRKAEHFLAFTSIACTLICLRRLTC
ncbi:transposase [Streptomyces griseoincarnatus]